MDLYALSINVKKAIKNHEKIIVFDPKNEIIDRSKLTMLHELKIEPQYFEDILHNGKNFEIRKDDRPYKKGDYLYLKEYLINGRYTGKEILA